MSTKTAKTRPAPKRKPKTILGQRRKARRTRKPKAAATPKTSKSAVLRQLVQRPEGATVAEMMEASGWKNHTCRAWISRGGGSPQKPGARIVRGEDGRYRQAAPVQQDAAAE